MFQEHATHLKIIRFQKFFHLVITKALIFVSKALQFINLRHLTCFTLFQLYHKLAKFDKEALIMLQFLTILAKNIWENQFETYMIFISMTAINLECYCAG